MEYEVPEKYLTPEFLAAVSLRQAPLRQAPLRQAQGTIGNQAQGTGGQEKIAGESPCLVNDPPESPPAEEEGLSSEVSSLRAPKPEIVPAQDSNLQAWARLEAVRLWRNFIEGKPEMVATAEFCQLIKDRSYPECPPWVYVGLSTKAGVVRISRMSLYEWAKKKAADLEPGYRGREGNSFFAQRPELLPVMESIIAEFGASAKRIAYFFESGLIKLEFGLEICPSYYQIRYWLSKWQKENTQRARAFATGDKTILRSGMGNFSRGLKPNDRWEIDSTKADVETRIQKIVWLHSKYGEAPVRCVVIACVDVATRRPKFLASPTSNGEAIALLTADCIREWGLPHQIKTDNGKDYIGKYVRGFYSAMMIEQKLCNVRCPWEKPHVERLMEILQHSDEWEVLPWNTGHNVAQIQANRKKREGEDVLPWTIEQFQSWLDRWAEAYCNRIHEGLGCTPNERLAEFAANGWVSLMPKHLEANLEFALLREELVTVCKKGIRYNNRFYIAPELGNLVGVKVAIRIDTNDPNKIVVYDDQDLKVAKLICVATWELALSPEEQAQIACSKPVVDQAVYEHDREVKKARKRLKNRIAKNPEELLPDRGGVAILKTQQEIEVATQKLVESVQKTVPKPQETLTSEGVAAHKANLQAELLSLKPKPNPPTDDQVLEGLVICLKNGTDPDPADLDRALNYLELPEGRGALMGYASRHRMGSRNALLEVIRNLKTPKEEAIG
jgi:hypothetical protein